MVNRGGGIVNTAGVEGAVINKRHAQLMFERHGKERGEGTCAWLKQCSQRVDSSNT